MRARMIRSGSAAAACVAALLAGSPAVAQEADVEVGPGGRVTYIDPSVGGETTTVTGTLLTIPTEDTGGSDEHVIQTRDGTLEPVTLAPSAADDLPAVGRVTAEVSESRTARVAQLTGQEVAAAAAAPSPTSNRVYLAIETGVLSSDAEVQDAVRTALADWVRDANGYLTSFTIAGVKRFAPSACDRTSSVAWNEAAAQFSGTTFSIASGNHLLLMSKAGCGSFGLGTYGSASGMGSGGNVWFRESDPEDPLQYVRQAVAHEVGHNFRLQHAGMQECTTASSCTIDDYGNIYSVMGASYADVATSALDTVSRDQLGTLSPCEQADVAMPSTAATLSGTWRIAPRGSSAGLRGLRITDPRSGVQSWIDWRDGTGQDAGTAYQKYRPVRGLTVQQHRDGADSTVLLRGVGSSAPEVVAPGASFTYGAVQVSAGTPSGGTIPVTVALSGTGSGAAPSMPGSVTTGPAAVGTNLTADLSGYPAGACHSYTWLRDGEPVGGATSSSYAVGAADLGHVVSVRVTSTASGYAPRTVTSQAQGVFSRPVIDSDGASGWVRVGARLHYAAAADWPTARNQAWYVGDQLVSTEATYVPTAADLASGDRVRLEVSFTSGGAPVTVTSPTRGVAAGVIVGQTPTIVGVRTVGRTLRAERGTWTPTPTFSYQWYASGVKIAGATKSTIVLAKAQRGKTITVWVSGAKAGYTTLKKGSAKTGKIS